MNTQKEVGRGYPREGNYDNVECFLPCMHPAYAEKVDEHAVATGSKLRTARAAMLFLAKGTRG